MKSIEERAWDYAVQYRGGDSFIAEGYIQGATDQKAIDDAYFADASKIVIDKACEWLSEQAFSWIDDNKVNEDTRKLKQQKIKELQDDFRKAMEE